MTATRTLNLKKDFFGAPLSAIEGARTTLENDGIAVRTLSSASLQVLRSSRNLEGPLPNVAELFIRANEDRVEVRAKLRVKTNENRELLGRALLVGAAVFLGSGAWLGVRDAALVAILVTLVTAAGQALFAEFLGGRSVRYVRRLMSEMVRSGETNEVQADLSTT